VKGKTESSSNGGRESTRILNEKKSEREDSKKPKHPEAEEEI